MRSLNEQTCSLWTVKSLTEWKDAADTGGTTESASSATFCKGKPLPEGCRDRGPTSLGGSTADEKLQTRKDHNVISHGGSDQRGRGTKSGGKKQVNGPYPLSAQCH